VPSLLINADDFGLTPGVNRAIAELHDAGCLRSTTLMATGAAFAGAVSLALARPSLAVGCHIVLTDGVPVLPASEIPSLVSDGVNFRPTLGRFIRDLMLGRLNESELEREATAQISKLQSAGLRVTHIDTHKHTHLFPAIVRPLARAALACGVHALRNPFEPQWSSAVGGSPLRKLQIRALARLHQPFFDQSDLTAIATTDGTLGISATGSLNAATLPRLLSSMPDGVWELVCHPGYVDAALDAVTTRLRRHRELEREALLAHIPHALRIDSSLQLISFSDVRPTPSEAS
jgi:predicted glycoside hydrolase/deacetylase ChbG (UPF0249 family)